MASGQSEFVQNRKVIVWLLFYLHCSGSSSDTGSKMTRAGYVTLALTTVGFSAGQIILLLITRNREAMTVLPMVVGSVFVLFMLLGALLHCAVRSKRKAA